MPKTAKSNILWDTVAPPNLVRENDVCRHGDKSQCLDCVGWNVGALQTSLN